MPPMRLPILMILLAALLVGCTMPIVASTIKPQSGTVLFKDDFSSPVSGWDHTQYEQGISDYYGGAYRILVNALDLNIWSTPHRQYADTRIEVDAGKLGGPDENRVGIICRSDGRNYYFFLISSDGYYGLGLFNNGQATLLGQKEMQRSQSIRTGMAVNHMRFDCNGETLSTYVNGLPLAQAKDAALQHGDVGVLAGTFKKAGTDVVFDNFVVLAP